MGRQGGAAGSGGERDRRCETGCEFVVMYELRGRGSRGAGRAGRRERWHAMAIASRRGGAREEGGVGRAGRRQKGRCSGGGGGWGRAGVGWGRMVGWVGRWVGGEGARGGAGEREPAEERGRGRALTTGAMGMGMGKDVDAVMSWQKGNLGVRAYGERGLGSPVLCGASSPRRSPWGAASWICRTLGR